MDSTDAKFWLGFWAIAGVVILISFAMLLKSQVVEADLYIEMARNGMAPIDVTCANVYSSDDNQRSLCEIYFKERL